GAALLARRRRGDGGVPALTRGRLRLRPGDRPLRRPALSRATVPIVSNIAASIRLAVVRQFRHDVGRHPGRARVAIWPSRSERTRNDAKPEAGPDAGEPDPPPRGNPDPPPR